MHRYRRHCHQRLLIAVLCLSFASGAWAKQTLFPCPKQLEAPVAFWTLVYTEVNTNSGYVHDAEHLDIIYKTLHFGAASPRSRRRIVRSASHHVEKILKKLGHGARTGLSSEEQRVLELWPDDTTNAEFRHAAHEVRFQLGQSDRFKAGLVRSGKWLGYIKQILKNDGLPLELSALPHVESSFNPTAYSKAGASGLWQFTRSTGLRYLRINHVLDERRDPYLSTKAAARLLQDNYNVLGTWPLAITAYNHGLAGMRRAKKEFGPHLGVIVKQYHSRTFGFASRNFYAAFLAALDVSRHIEKYFGHVKLSPPLHTIVTPVPNYIAATTLAGALNVNLSELERLNPALMPTVWHGEKFVPKNFPLRLPASMKANQPADLIAAISPTKRYTAQQPDVQHRIRRGETLSQIADEYDVSLASLVRLNGLGNRNFIRAGQVLALPLPSETPPVTLAQANGGGGTYVVHRGDSLDRIAMEFGVDVNALLAANNIDNKNLIYIGQTLRLPHPDADISADSAVELASANASTADAIAVAAVDTGREPATVTAAVSHGQAPSASLVAATDVKLADTGNTTNNDGADTAAIDGQAGADESSDDIENPTSPDSNAFASNQDALAADPTDYSVASDGTITVQSLETLGHYAEWLGLVTQHLRDINGLPFGRAVVIGQTLKLDFSHVTPERFEQKRIAYHQQLQEAFFSHYHITSVEKHVVKRGESLWLLALHTYGIPIWLLRQYNPDLDLDHVSPGTVVKFPRLTANKGNTGD